MTSPDVIAVFQNYFVVQHYSPINHGTLLEEIDT
jgi:hypothetical protein